MNRKSFWQRWLMGTLAACVCSTSMLFAQGGGYQALPPASSSLQPLPYVPPGTNTAPKQAVNPSLTVAPVSQPALPKGLAPPPALPASSPPQIPMQLPPSVPQVPIVPLEPTGAKKVLVPATTTPAPAAVVPISPFGQVSPASAPGKTVQGPKEGNPEPIPAPAAAPVEAAPAVEEIPSVYPRRHHGFHGGGGGCSSCGGGAMCGPTAGCIGCGAGMRCYPGRNPCCDCDHDTCLGRVWCGLYHCICCPDPCYEGKFIPEANSAFWVDSARPVTQTRLRLDLGYGFKRPDRSEFFWARSGGGIGKGPNLIEQRLNYAEMSVAQEIAAKNFSFTIETPYRETDPIVNTGESGFGDMSLTAKTLLLDCDLLQIATQFRTYLPVGKSRDGLGTGHVSLEPSLLMTMKLLPETYLQSQVSEWIPIAGDPNYAGPVLHYHMAVNHVMFRFMPDVLLIGSAEFTGYSFQDGMFSDPVLGLFQSSSGGTYLYAGPSLRLSICNRLDFGGSSLYNIDSGGGAEQLYRMELRLRF